MSHDVQLSTLLANDECPSEKTLTRALGDRYLYRHNILFRTIRNAALSMGYVYEYKPTDLWLKYQVSPLLCLQDIIRLKVIPYLDNRTAWSVLSSANPEVTVPLNFIMDATRHNHAFHESCHCVAHCLLNRNSSLTDYCPDGRAKVVWEAILSEAFANTCEKVAVHLAEALAHAIFCGLNSYMQPNKNQGATIRKICARYGIRRCFGGLFAAYVQANTSMEHAPTNTAISEILRTVRSSENGEEKTTPMNEAAELAEMAFRINIEFRQETACFYYRMLGCEDVFTNILRRDSAFRGLVTEYIPHLVAEWADIVVAEGKCDSYDLKAFDSERRMAKESRLLG